MHGFHLFVQILRPGLDLLQIGKRLAAVCLAKRIEQRAFQTRAGVILELRHERNVTQIGPVPLADQRAHTVHGVDEVAGFELRALEQARYCLRQKAEEVVERLPACFAQARLPIHFQTCLAQRDQGAGKIARIHRRDIAGLERLQGRGIDPVEYVTTIARHAGQRIQRVTQPAYEVRYPDKAQIPRHQRRQKHHCDIRRRRSLRHFSPRRFLKVIGR